MELPAISLWQPWASLIFAGVKHHETRHWRPPARLIGKRIAIHAAKRVERDVDLYLNALCAECFGADWAKTLPRGAVLGTAVLASVRVADIDDVLGDPADVLCGDWSPGRYLWRLTAVTAFPSPIPFVGRQGFFTVNTESEHA